MTTQTGMGPSPTMEFTVARVLWEFRLALGVAAMVLGGMVLAWPGATVRVAGLLFGLYLLAFGVFRIVAGLAGPSLSIPYRVLSTAIGVLGVVVGVICLRNMVKSAVLLAVFVGIGWLLQGISEIAAGAMGSDDPLRYWRIAAGAAYVVAALVVLSWPGLSLAAFIMVGGVVLILVGLAEAVGAVLSARTLRAH